MNSKIVRSIESLTFNDEIIANLMARKFSLINKIYFSVQGNKSTNFSLTSKYN